MQLPNPLDCKASGSVGLVAELHARCSLFEPYGDHHIPDLKKSFVKFVDFALISEKTTSLE